MKAPLRSGGWPLWFAVRDLEEKREVVRGALGLRRIRFFENGNRGRSTTNVTIALFKKAVALNVDHIVIPICQICDTAKSARAFEEYRRSIWKIPETKSARKLGIETTWAIGSTIRRFTAGA